MKRGPERVTIVEVGPRDGLQNEATPIATATKLELIARLRAAGLPVIEVTAFVSPKWVPQMADHAELLATLMRDADAAAPRYPVLVPNLKGLDAALAAGAREIAVFTAASESFCRKNINCSIQESLERFAPVIERARAAGVAVRGYVSCVVGCPYEGAIAPQAVARVAKALWELGCREISLGDTIGVSTPDTIERMLAAVAAEVPMDRLAGHFHDTYGMAVANVVAAWQMGVATFDASVGGLGGCPYAPGAAGNVATEALVYLFERMGVATGVALEPLVDTAWWISAQLGRTPNSRVALALARKEKTNRDAGCGGKSAG
ncbi:MAG: hydroxymethylglutaryl-CoA lyase [Hydrogenophilus thermoluteolus]|nr:hydroxymethylglutaryl-CoA lyase [Hydrogenophilus thermoluteolus]MBW7656624.1 hydroxymethylglutaryl-CoA lyase [Hydrogenophilus thermoluteolus]HNQ49278.1 hydroxymethylglutaryl-CoA lyase [Hydrogenophilus thermoluteolus]HNU19009.1 hydroxymethylglutaryl-CoA lyase [Hydrogenophilus thermoluteolus]